MIIKRNINFWLDSRKKNGVSVTENLAIRMRLAYCGKTFDYFTGFRIDAGKWDAEKQAHGEIETFHPGFLVAQDT